MIRKLFITVAIGIILSAVACNATEPNLADIESRFGKLLRNTKVTSLKPSPVKGLYEVIAGPNVFYFSPEGEGHLLFGQIVDKDGTNLTAAVQSRLKEEFDRARKDKMAAIAKFLPLEKALKIGNGPNTVIEFTDPDCPYCRKVDEFFTKRKDVTRYIFLFPLDNHPNAKTKALYILGNKDPGKAFHEVFTGVHDAGLQSAFTADPGAARQLADNMKIGADLGVRGTPMLIINGNLVDGADMKRISQLLDN